MQETRSAVSPATNVMAVTKARMLRTCFVQTTMGHKLQNMIVTNIIKVTQAHL